MGYLQMKGESLRFWGGGGGGGGGVQNQGSVIHGCTEEGYYDPQDADHNFVIPSQSRNFTTEAKFCHLVWEWYEADDCRGISAMERLQRILNMR